MHYRWAGLSNVEGQRVMRRLESPSRMPLQDVHYFGVQIASLSDEVGSEGVAPTAVSASQNNGIGSLQLLLGGQGLQVIDLNVARYADCYLMAF